MRRSPRLGPRPGDVLLDLIPDGYASEIVWDGLKPLDYSIVPHLSEILL